VPPTTAASTSTSTTSTVPAHHATSSTTIKVKGTNVTSPPATTAVGPASTLPFTGSASFPLVIVALALIGAGLGLMVRRKRRAVS